MLPPPTKENAEYRGWLAKAENWDAIDGQVIRELSQYTDFRDIPGITLTAVMEPWVTFDPDGNPFTDDNSTEPRRELQSDIDALPAVTKPDYTFDGWVTEEEPDDPLTLADVKALEDPITVKPKLSAKVTFHANGGTVKGGETLTIGLSKISALPAASRSGYSLSGWFTEAMGGTAVTYAALTAANVPTTVYAHWTKIVPAAPSGGGGGFGGGGGGGTPSTPDLTITVETPDDTEVIPVKPGEDKTIPVEVEPDKTLIDVVVDGESIGPVDKCDLVDIQKGHTIKVIAVSTLNENHIAYLNSYPDGNVRPNGSITRAETAAIFARLLSPEVYALYLEKGQNGAAFPDVVPGSWYADSVAALRAMGVLQGYPDGTFQPSAPVSRAEFAAIVTRFRSLKEAKNSFPDVPAGHWAEDEIASAHACGWVEGYPDGTFRPEAAITRAEAVKMVNGMLGRKADRSFLISCLGGLKSYADLNEAHWAYFHIMEASQAHYFEKEGDSERWTSLR